MGMAMTAAEFALAVVRLIAILLPAVVAAHWLRRRFFPEAGAIAVLVEVVLALTVLLVVAELVGAASLETFWPLVGLLVVIAVAVFALVRRGLEGVTRAASR